MSTDRDGVPASRAGWREKVGWSIGLTAFFCVPYFALQRLDLWPARTLPLSRLDAAVAFDPAWTWLYQSGYVLLSAVPWALDRRGDLRRYARGFVGISLAGFLVFLVLPIAGPRPAVVPSTGAYALLAAYDAPTNAFPSLHVALLTFTVLVAARATRGRLSPWARGVLVGGAAAWALAVAYAALATKQHYAVDLAAGLLLAVAVDRRLS